MALARDGRMFQPVLTALVKRNEGRIVLLCPAVGNWRGGPRTGDLLGPGEDLGQLDVLGQLHRLVVPKGVSGAVVEDPDRASSAPIAVDYRTRLVELDPQATPSTAVEAQAAVASASGMIFRAPLGGRFYGRPTPSAPHFVAAGDVVRAGQTVALLEVMKTFNRVVFGGDDMPAQARVKRVVPDDESDIDEGDPILEVEPLA